MATLTLFEMMTTEGWLVVMYGGVDARGINKQPKRLVAQCDGVGTTRRLGLDTSSAS